MHLSLTSKYTPNADNAEFSQRHVYFTGIKSVMLPE